MEYVVELRGVDKAFGDHHAVKSVSFGIRPGEFFSLLGPSGCGKSTTLRMISGFESPDSGTIVIGGKDVTGVPPYRRPTNLVFQRLALFPHLSVYENVAFGLRAERVADAEIRQRVADALALVDLTTFRDRKPGVLSGGQMQRVALARALVKRPQVLLLDEPLGALDLKLRLQMQTELKRIQSEVGTTFIYVTHDQSEALTMSDRIAVMNNGLVEQIGTPQEIYEGPVSRFVAGFIGNSNFLGVRVEKVDGERCVLSLGNGLSAICRGTNILVGSDAHLALRHERILVGESAAASENQFSAQVESVTFAGSAVQYTLALEHLRLTAAVPYASGVRILNRNERVLVGWNSWDGRVLAK